MPRNLVLSGNLFVCPAIDIRYIEHNLPGGYDDFLFSVFFMFSMDSSGMEFGDILDTCDVTDVGTRSTLLLLLMKHMTQIADNPAIPILAKHRLINLEIKEGKYILEIDHDDD